MEVHLSVIEAMLDKKLPDMQSFSSNDAGSSVMILVLIINNHRKPESNVKVLK